MVTGWGRGAALYEATVRHTRLRPIEHRLSHRTFYWLVDVDEPPRPPAWLRLLAGFRTRDHIADPGRSLRDSVTDFAAAEGVDVRGCRIRMLAHARAFGHVFNPLTVYWCRHPEDGLRCVVAEVHNTYGERHRYLLRPGADGRATAAKDFYVSPFLPVAGDYRMALPEPEGRLRLSVALELDGEPTLVATVSGRRRSAGTAALLKATARHPLNTLAVTADIRRHGIGLWLKGLPVFSREPEQEREAHRERTR
ncbi:DUF1365 domain-containing protein [Glycomyces sp. A-F 0318]|uniref:DUF1365 domain-containing protein n=1 Tax=Glycomyces amatae TaxID=2881355 RepID=UPI001E353002|nr:DUF1365 domain-containing protein [Glycomyces amatae]